jgi:hypothetical protein
MSQERVVALIGSHRVRIARALVRQIRTLSPRYGTIDSAALEQSLLRILSVVSHFLQTGDDGSLRNLTTHTAQLRQALGFSVDDFMSAGLAFLPVMRRFLLEHARTIETGLADYEAFEAVAIPLIAELARMFRVAGAVNAKQGDHYGFDDDDDNDITLPNRLAVVGKPGAFKIERVVGGDDEELTPFS